MKTVLTGQIDNYPVKEYDQPARGGKAGLGVTQFPFANSSIREIPNFAQVSIRFFESRWYLKDVTAYDPLWRLQNMNLIFNR